MSKKLLFSVTKKDLDITYFSGKGAGGQHRNRHMNCVRIKHSESGVIVTGQEERSKDRNLKTAFLRLTKHPKFKLWLKLKSSENYLSEVELNKKIDKMMEEENLKIEYGI